MCLLLRNGRQGGRMLHRMHLGRIGCRMRRSGGNPYVKRTLASTNEITELFAPLIFMMPKCPPCCIVLLSFDTTQRMYPRLDPSNDSMPHRPNSGRHADFQIKVKPSAHSHLPICTTAARETKADGRPKPVSSWRIPSWNVSTVRSVACTVSPTLTEPSLHRQRQGSCLGAETGSKC